MNNGSFTVGQRVELNDNRIAIIRFLGSTRFQTGDWVGVELGEPTGKNDGSVKGQRYFDCEQDYGMFLRPSGIRRVVDEGKPKDKATNGVAGKSRPSSVHQGVNGLKRQAALDVAGRRASAIGGSPTPGPRLGGGVQSPSKSPTKQLTGNRAGSSTSTSRTSTPPGRTRPATGPAAKPRPSIAPPSTSTADRRTSILPGAGAAGPQRGSRPSLAPPSASSRTAQARAPPVRPAAPPSRPSQGPRMSSTTEETGEDDDSERPNAVSPRTESSQPTQHETNGDREAEEDPIKPSFAPPPIPPDPAPQTRTRRPSSPTAASIHSQRTIRSTTASNREIEELQAKVRLLERKRMEDREVKRTLEQAQLERDSYKNIIEKLQAKYRPQQQEIAELKAALSEAEKRFTDTETLQAEHDSVMELATLDREMAEEKAEGMEAELEALRAKNDELELELEILRDDNGELSKEMSPEDRASAGWAQMERSNERLRDALLRLRDITQDKEAELKERIDTLEDQVKEVDGLQKQYEETKEKLLRSEADNDDLREQLEAALMSEEVIDELTERNGRLDAQMSQLRQTIEELEDLRDINDELQINYSEQEKQLQEEIDFKDSLLVDRERTAKQQQEALDEADYTVTRYRGLVTQMQSDLADMQASKQLSETEAADVNNKSRAMLDLNLKLQASASKTQVKTLDLELRKLDAQEASEHLAIVQLFLPEAFRAERDSVLALLRFKRIGFKANLVQSFVKERIASFGTRGQDEDVFAACDVSDKLTWIAAMAERFVSSICSCNVEDFTRYEGALYELEPVERALNSYIDGLRRDEVKERDWAEQLARSIAVMEHLAGVHVKYDLASHADDLMMRTLCLQSRLESAATAIGLIRSMVEKNVPPTPNADGEHNEDADGTASDLSHILNRAESLVLSARNAKVMAGKTYRSLADLQARSLTLEFAQTEYFDRAEDAAALVATYTRHAGEALQVLFGEEGRAEDCAPDEVSGALSRTAVSTFSLQAPDAGPFSALATRLRDLQDQLSDLASLPTDLDNTVEFERAPAPWVARANELKQTKITSIDTEAELKRTLETLRERDVIVREKETELEEQSVRIEMLEARMKEASKRSAKIAELERSLHEARDAEKKAHADLVKAQQDAEKQVERVREEMGRLADERRKGGDGGEIDSDAMGAGAKITMKRQEFKITSLEGAVRYLKEENHRLRLPPPDSPLSIRATMDWLHEPILKPKSDQQKRHEALRKEGSGVLKRMLELAAQPQVVDLTKMPENKLAWRPKKEMPSWQVAKSREEWAALKGWGEDVSRKATSRPALRSVTHTLMERNDVHEIEA